MIFNKLYVETIKIIKGNHIKYKIKTELIDYCHVMA